MHDGDDDYFDPHEVTEEPPLYQPGELAVMTDARLQREWNRQCRIHDNGVDHLPMGTPTIETAAARMRMVVREIEARGLKVELEDATGP